MGRITATGVTLNTTTTAGDVTVNGITDANSTNSGAITINAGGTVSFATGASTFNKGVAVNANDGVVVGVTLWPRRATLCSMATPTARWTRRMGLASRVARAR